MIGGRRVCILQYLGLIIIFLFPGSLSPSIDEGNFIGAMYRCFTIIRGKSTTGSTPTTGTDLVVFLTGVVPFGSIAKELHVPAMVCYPLDLIAKARDKGL